MYLLGLVWFGFFFFVFVFSLSFALPLGSVLCLCLYVKYLYIEGSQRQVCAYIRKYIKGMGSECGMKGFRYFFRVYIEY